MTYPAKGYGTFGPVPWHQKSWDIRAAGNFIGGGMGSGLVVFAALAGATGAAGAALFALSDESSALGGTLPVRGFVFASAGALMNF